MRPHVSQRRILAHTSSTPSLNSTIKRIQQCLWHKHLSLSNLLLCSCSVAIVDCDGSVADNQAASIDFDAGFGEALEHDFMLVEWGAKGGLGGVVDAGDEEVEGFFGLSLFIYMVSDFVFCSAWWEMVIEHGESLNLQHRWSAWRGGYGQDRDGLG